MLLVLRFFGDLVVLCMFFMLNFQVVGMFYVSGFRFDWFVDFRVSLGFGAGCDLLWMVLWW